jgi:nicotinamidase/pyrazinamidase
MKIHMLAIDPQIDFTDANGSLFVPGGHEDMERLASFIGDITPKLDRLHITLDQHHDIDISHPYWYADENGDPAKPITIMSYDASKDVFVGFCPIDGSTVEYRTRKQGLHKHTRSYIEALSATGRYAHTVWPEHCRIATPGANMHPAIEEAQRNWARSKVSTVNFVAKGSNPFTEHFSAVQAEVPQPNDPSTQTNTDLVTTLEDADLVFVGAEALSHCVANTVRDIIAAFSDPAYAQKIVLLTDCCSNVPGFEAQGDQFLKDMKAVGMKAMTAADARALIA